MLDDVTRARIDLPSLPRRALCIAVDAGDPLGEAAALWEAQGARGDALRTLVLRAGSASASGASGAREVRCLELPATTLGARTDLVARIGAAITEFAPELVYVPAPSPGDEDRRAAGAACAAALAAHPDVRALSYDRTGAVLASDAREVLARVRSELAPNDDAWAATAVISTWNKVADVCANLDGIRAQTRPFSEVIVVDNASSDATAATLRERYPEVRLTVMPHSSFGACETFNLGFASAHGDLVGILDDDDLVGLDGLRGDRLQVLARNRS